MNNSSRLFKGRKLVIGTKHKKEQVIAPYLEENLGVECFVDNHFDTDILGTFSGEMERKLDPISTLRKKCLLAMESTHCDLGVANEGSFGPHPSLFFSNADEELVILIDKKNNLEIIAREISLETNFNAKEISKLDDLLVFSKFVGFPSHGLMLRAQKNKYTEIQKGIVDIEQLKKKFYQLREKNNSVYVETDMRAMFNPTRMKVIQKVTQKLIDKIKNSCPNCETPGFSVTEAIKGLKCANCGLPTKSILRLIYTCQNCNFSKEEVHPNNKEKEDPMYCDYCNP